MKRFALALGFAVALLGLAPALITAYGGSVAQALDGGPQFLSFPVTLSGANENPANGSPATGSGFVQIDPATHQLHINVSFSGLTGPTIAAHIHCCIAPPGNTGVATTVPAFPGFPLGVTSGSYDGILDMTQASSWNPAFIVANGGTTAGAESALVSGAVAGRAYLNIHTTTFPPGEIRAFLVLQQGGGGGASSIPTLSGWALVAFAALLILTAFVYLRKRAT